MSFFCGTYRRWAGAYLGAVALVGGAALGSAKCARAEGAAATTVSADGVALKSVSVELPTSDRLYPNGPNSQAMNNNCLTCHSAGMVLTQPKLTRAQWQAEVTKMVKVYKAPVAPADVAPIVDYLAQLQPGK